MLLVKIAEILDVDIKDLLHPTKFEYMKTSYMSEKNIFKPIGRIKI